MRCSARRLVMGVAVCAFLVLVVKFLPSNNKPKSWPGCKVPLETRERLSAILALTHEVLDDLRITHFLCYGSLWGFLRRGKPLVWMNTAQLCVFNEQLIALDEVFLLKTFRNKGLDMRYDWREGEYHVTLAKEEACECRVEVVVFERASSDSDEADEGMVRRIGWKRRILPPTCDLSPSLNCFPARLVDPPLATVPFDNLNLQVPREESELQKYLYPDDWWMEIRPPGCEHE